MAPSKVDLGFLSSLVETTLNESLDPGFLRQG
jgi:hypothetical protein